MAKLTEAMVRHLCAIEIGRLVNDGYKLDEKSVKETYEWARRDGSDLNKEELTAEVRNRLKDAING